MLANSEGDAANIAAAFFEFADFWSNDVKAVSLEGLLELGGMSGHDGGFAGTDEVAGEAFGGFLIIN